MSATRDRAVRTPWLLVAASILAVSILLVAVLRGEREGSGPVPASSAPAVEVESDSGPGSRRVAIADVFEGTLVVLGRTEPVDGTLLLRGVDGTELTADVVGSTWRVAAAGSSRWAVVDVDADDPAMPIHLLDPRLELGPGSASGAVVRATAHPCIQVFEAGSASELDEVTVHSSAQVGTGEGPHHPGPVSQAGRVLPAPVDVRHLEPGQHWITATDRTWVQVAVGHGAPFVRRVELAPAGAARVRADSLTGIREPVVEILDGEGSVFTRAGLGEASPYLTGLPEGDYTARLVGRAEAGPPRTYAREPFAMSAGDVASVVFRRPAEPPRPVAVTGYVRSDGGGPLPDGAVGEVVLEPETVPFADAPQETVRLALGTGLLGDASEGLLEWAPVELLPGTYVVKVKPVGVRLEVRVPDGVAHHHLDVRLPDLGEVSLHFVDEATGGDAKVDLVLYSTLLGGEPGEVVPGTQAATVRGSRVTLLLGVGPLQLMTISETYGPLHHAGLSVRPGEREITVRLVRPVQVDVHLTSGEVPYRVGFEWWRQMRFVGKEGDGELGFEPLLTAGTPRSRGGGHAAARFRLREPGRYELRFPGAPRWFELDLASGDVLDVDVASWDVRLRRGR